MAPTPLSPASLRLVACLETFEHDEAGAVAQGDWAGLVAILEREGLLLTRLAQEKPSEAQLLKPHVERLAQRLARLSASIEVAKAQNTQELASLGESTQRMHAVRNAYLKA
jgi:hypothetical protein